MLNDPTFWVLVSFLLFCGVFGKKIVTLLRSMAETQIQTVSNCLSEAQNNLEASRRLLHHVQEETHALDQRLAEMRQTREKEITFVSEQFLQREAKRKEHFKSQYDRRIQLYQDQLMRDLHESILSDIMAVAELLVRERASDKSDTIVGRALGQFPSFFPSSAQR